MKNRGPIAKAVAILLVVAVPSVVIPVTSARENARLSGTIYSVGGEAPLADVVLHAGDMRTGTIYSSERTGADGGFALADLPPAAYELAVEKDGGLYVIDAPVRLDGGQDRNLQVALNAEVAPDPETATRKKRSAWDRPLIATLLVIGGAIVVGALVSSLDDEKDEVLASPEAAN